MNDASQTLLATAEEISPSGATKTEINWWGPGIVFLFCTLFLLLKISTSGVHLFHLFFLAAVFLLYFLHSTTRKIVVIGIPMAIYGVIYDLLRYIPFEWLKPIHVQDLFQIDQKLFGVSLGAGVMSLHQYIFDLLAHPVADFISGFVYFLHIPVVLILLVILWRFRSAVLAQRFMVAFLVLNILAFLTYYFYSAAPPWYVAKYGFTVPLGPVLGDAAGLARFDRLFGINFFTSSYQISPVAFGAMPSLHAGYATLGWLYSFKINRKLGFLMGIYVLLMCFSAMYTQHHYMLDLVMGILFALLSWLLIEKVFLKGVNSINRSVWEFFYQNSAGTIFKGRGEQKLNQN